MLKSIFIVGLGSFVGGALRYSISMLMKNICGQCFPFGTLLVNLLGCFAFGAIFALFGRYGNTSSYWCLLLTTGFCGGFTTFSTFANECVQMLQNGNLSGFAGYVTASIILGFALVALGFWAVKQVAM